MLSVYCVWYMVPLRELRRAEKDAGMLGVANRPILPTLNHQDGFRERYEEETIPTSLVELLSARPRVPPVSHLCSCLILGIILLTPSDTKYVKYPHPQLQLDPKLS